MLISLSDKFLFVHIQRTGGTSLRKALRQHFPQAHRFISPHPHAEDAMQRLGPQAFQQLYRFTFVRNPWDRLVSWYTMLREKAWRPNWRRTDWWGRYRWEAVQLPFAEFITASTIRKQLQGRNRWRSRNHFAFNQLDYLTDHYGNLLVNDIFRFEDYQASCLKLGEKLGISLADMPHRNSSRHADYRTYYTPAIRNLVTERFALDIDYFGYSFS
jgi:hypothetical protein